MLGGRSVEVIFREMWEQSWKGFGIAGRGEVSVEAFISDYSDVWSSKGCFTPDVSSLLSLQILAGFFCDSFCIVIFHKLPLG